MASPRVFDGANREVKLGRQLGAGGEGAVFEVVGQSSQVAKLYHQPPPAERADKLRYMASHVSGELTKISAWPITTLHDRVGAPVRGFVMPRIPGKEIHVLYGVNHRRKEFPKADWRFLTHAAMNCAAVFDTVHRAGYVIADVNQKNVVASDTATVGLLDCDSLQMTINGKLDCCEVGVAEYTPPELQGKSFRGVVRTQNHDLFGLAIHIFHLLFMGRHPFMGRFAGGDKALEDAIREMRFVYGQGAAQKQMRPPPHSLPLSLVPPGVGEMFEKTFSERGVSGGRPTAAEWQVALRRLVDALKVCGADKAHTFSTHLGNCPWCAVTQSGGPFYFITVQLGGLQFICGAKELEPLWKQVTGIKQISPALPSPNVSSPAPSPLPPDVVAARRRGRLVKFASVGTIAASLLFLVAAASPGTMPTVETMRPSSAQTATAEVIRERAAARTITSTGLPIAMPNPFAATTAGAGLVLGASAWGYCRWIDRYGKERSRRRNAVRGAEQVLEHLRQQWKASHDRYAATAKAIGSRVADLRTGYLELQPSFDGEIRQLEATKEQAQLRDFLDDQYIERAKIPKVGDGRKTILRGYGIETALDVIEKRGLDIPGFGPVLRNALLDWARTVSQQFRFDPRKGVPEAERRLRVAEYRRKQALLEAQIRQAAAELQQLAQATSQRGNELATAIQGATHAVMQARADVSVI
jgi:DNA-binding helix-hairpin-helix protein with protein kinase domain